MDSPSPNNAQLPDGLSAFNGNNFNTNNVQLSNDNEDVTSFISQSNSQVGLGGSSGNDFQNNGQSNYDYEENVKLANNENSGNSYQQQDYHDEQKNNEGQNNDDEIDNINVDGDGLPIIEEPAQDTVGLFGGNNENNKGGSNNKDPDFNFDFNVDENEKLVNEGINARPSSQQQEDDYPEVDDEVKIPDHDVNGGQLDGFESRPNKNRPNSDFADDFGPQAAQRPYSGAVDASLEVDDTRPGSLGFNDPEFFIGENDPSGNAELGDDADFDDDEYKTGSNNNNYNDYNVDVSDGDGKNVNSGQQQQSTFDDIDFAEEGSKQQHQGNQGGGQLQYQGGFRPSQQSN